MNVGYTATDRQGRAAEGWGGTGAQCPTLGINGVCVCFFIIVDRTTAVLLPSSSFFGAFCLVVCMCCMESRMESRMETRMATRMETRVYIFFVSRYFLRWLGAVCGRYIGLSLHLFISIYISRYMGAIAVACRQLPIIYPSLCQL